jgi:hypothetical protein
MSKITRIDAGRNLTCRRKITLELPEFLIRAFEVRVADANAEAHHENHEDPVTVENLVELELAEALSLGEVALLEERIPGISSAVSAWLTEIV